MTVTRAKPLTLLVNTWAVVWCRRRRPPVTWRAHRLQTRGIFCSAPSPVVLWWIPPQVNWRGRHTSCPTWTPLPEAASPPRTASRFLWRSGDFNMSCFPICHGPSRICPHPHNTSFWMLGLPQHCHLPSCASCMSTGLRMIWGKREQYFNIRRWFNCGIYIG